MNPAVIIRNETDADVSIITEMTVTAFKTLEISNHTEQFIIEALRAAKALTLSLVTEVDGRVVGHPQYYRKFDHETFSNCADKPMSSSNTSYGIIKTFLLLMKKQEKVLLTLD